MNRSPLADRPTDSLIYLTGCSNAGTRAAARGRTDLGVLVTPLLPAYLEHVGDYPAWAVDNGAFSKSVPFDPAAFRKLVKAAADSPHRSKCLFVVCPDVVGDPAATLASWREWSAELRATGLPVAFVLQDGCERGEADRTLFEDGIPWGEFDVLFVGGSTDWKIGLPSTVGRNWMEIFRRCDRENIPVHMGRVNSWERCEIAFYGLGCRSADGTFIAYGPRANLPQVVGWLDRANRPHNNPEKDR